MSQIRNHGGKARRPSTRLPRASTPAGRPIPRAATRCVQACVAVGHDRPPWRRPTRIASPARSASSDALNAMTACRTRAQIARAHASERSQRDRSRGSSLRCGYPASLDSPWVLVLGPPGKWSLELRIRRQFGAPCVSGAYSAYGCGRRFEHGEYTPLTPAVPHPISLRVGNH